MGVGRFWRGTLAYMPADYPARGWYVTQFKEMARAVADLQGEDGLWRSGLLDAGAYRQPEVSGSAFFTFALAWGINEGLLDRKAYEPVVAKAWKGLIGHIYADGRLGSIQKIWRGARRAEPRRQLRVWSGGVFAGGRAG